MNEWYAPDGYRIKTKDFFGIMVPCLLSLLKLIGVRCRSAFELLCKIQVPFGECLSARMTSQPKASLNLNSTGKSINSLGRLNAAE